MTHSYGAGGAVRSHQPLRGGEWAPVQRRVHPQIAAHAVVARGPHALQQAAGNLPLRRFGKAQAVVGAVAKRHRNEAQTQCARVACAQQRREARSRVAAAGAVRARRRTWVGLQPLAELFSGAATAAVATELKRLTGVRNLQAA